jgi:phage shock protein PspC (stress-responsive transcriptional regulator)
MHQLITVSLDDHAFQIQDDGYNALRQYLDRARRGLRGNPDIDEILGDLERAIAEKCSALLTPTKTAIMQGDVAQILDQIGPVEGAAGEEPQPQKAAAGRADTDENKEEDSDARAPKRLYRIGEGAVLAGVCTGLASYLDVDVLLVRLIFVAITIMTSGFGGIVAYIIMTIFVPYAPFPRHRTSTALRSTVAVVAIGGIAVLLLISIWHDALYGNWPPTSYMFPMRMLFFAAGFIALALLILVAIALRLRSRTR